MNEDGDWKGWSAFKAQVASKLTVVEAPRDQPEEEGPNMPLSAEDANNIIRFLSAAYMSTTSAEARKEFNRLANELRKASGQPPQP